MHFNKNKINLKNTLIRQTKKEKCQANPYLSHDIDAKQPAISDVYNLNSDLNINPKHPQFYNTFYSTQNFLPHTLNNAKKSHSQQEKFRFNNYSQSSTFNSSQSNFHKTLFITQKSKNSKPEIKRNYSQLSKYKKKQTQPKSSFKFYYQSNENYPEFLKSKILTEDFLYASDH